MFGEVRSSELETGLSFSDDHLIPEKLVEAQEKKAKGGLVSGLLSKKHSKVGDVSKDDLVITPPFAHSLAKHPASPTSSLEVIASIGEETKKKKKVGCKSFLPPFWDDADAATLKAHETLYVDDLNPLMAKSSSEVMSSHIQRHVQKSLQVEKDFCKLKDEQIGDLELKLQKVGAMAMQEFKDFDEYSDNDVEKELLSDRPSEAMAENVMEETTTVVEVIEEAAPITPADSFPGEQ
nr:hypothetical protein CFP56_02075 [Quercus suber]